MAKRRKASLEQSSPRSAALPPAETQNTLLDVEALRQIIELLENSDVTQLSLRKGEESLTIRRGQAATTIVQAVPAVAAASRAETPSAERAARPSQPPASAEKPGQLVTSPFVGTFYRTPGPDQPPFVELGTSVRKGRVLCIVEAMKLMNEIEAEASGTIAEIFVENGQPVDFGQPLFRVEPSS